MAEVPAIEVPVRPVVWAEVIRVAGPGVLPRSRSNGDAGFDLYVYRPDGQPVVIEPHSFADIPSGISIELPPGVWGLIKPRSSTLRQRQLLVIDGVIDTGYRGELFTAVWNLSDERRYVNDGERLAQLIPFAHVRTYVVRCEELSPSERGTGGFGSTGR